MKKRIPLDVIVASLENAITRQLHSDPAKKNSPPEPFAWTRDLTNPQATDFKWVTTTNPKSPLEHFVDERGTIKMESYKMLCDSMVHKVVSYVEIVAFLTFGTVHNPFVSAADVISKIQHLEELQALREEKDLDKYDHSMALYFRSNISVYVKFLQKQQRCYWNTVAWIYHSICTEYDQLVEVFHGVNNSPRDNSSVFKRLMDIKEGRLPEKTKVPVVQEPSPKKRKAVEEEPEPDAEPVVEKAPPTRKVILKKKPKLVE